MPGPHLDVCVFQCHLDVGGCDIWTSSWYGPSGQWHVGWHSNMSFPNWHLGDEASYTLIGYEFWRKDDEGNDWMAEADYADPNPSLSPSGSDLTPVGHWHGSYEQQGQLTSQVDSPELLMWQEETAFLKGRYD